MKPRQKRKRKAHAQRRQRAFVVTVSESDEPVDNDAFLDSYARALIREVQEEPSMTESPRNAESPQNTELSESLAQTIAHSDLPSVAADIIDGLLDSHLPIISAVVGVWKTGCTVKDALFLRRLAAFLSDLSAIPKGKRRQMIESLQADDTAENVGEKLLTLLDRLESTQKARLLAKAFALYASETITSDEFWRVSFVLDRLPLSDILVLKSWRTVDLDNVGHVRKHLYLAVGLGWFVLNASSTGFQWTDRLCSIFSDHLVGT